MPRDRRLSHEELQEVTADLLRFLNEEADPRILHEYHQAFKKQIPFFRRNHVGAYFMALLASDPAVRNAAIPDTGSRGRRAATGPASDDKSRRREAKGREPKAGPVRARGRVGEEASQGGGTPPPPDAEQATLFISIGRNRRVFPKDIVGMFANIDGISAEQIGEIRIMDNYSFVEVDRGVADTLIQKLSGEEYRGRKLNVDYARKKDD